MSEENKDKVLVYKILTATTLLIPFDPDNPNTVDATAGMIHTATGLTVPLKSCLEELLSTAVSFGVDRRRCTGPSWAHRVHRGRSNGQRKK